MKHLVYTQLQNLFDVSTDLANMLPETSYAVRILKNTDSTIGQHFLEMVCQRERYLYALRYNHTREWSCSIDNPHNKLKIMQGLFHASADILVWIDAQDEIDQDETATLMDIFFTEAQVQGRIALLAELQGVVLPGLSPDHS